MSHTTESKHICKFSPTILLVVRLAQLAEDMAQFVSYTTKIKVLPEPHGPLGGADLVSSPQPDTSLHCETMDTGLVHHMVRLFTSQPLGWYQIILLGDRGTWV